MYSILGGDVHTRTACVSVPNKDLPEVYSAAKSRLAGPLVSETKLSGFHL